MEIKIEIPAEEVLTLLRLHNTDTFKCECRIVHESDLHRHTTGDGIERPITIVGVTEFHRYYIVITPT